MFFRRKRDEYVDIHEKNVKISNLNGILISIAANLCIPFATVFAKRLNASDSQIALLSSLPAIVSMCVIIPGAVFLKKIKDKKNVTGKFFILTRIFYLLFALVPLIGENYRAGFFVIIYGFMNLPGSIANVSWQSFIADLFPPFVRGRALASRNRFATLVGVITTLSAGWLLNNIPRNNDERMLLYQVFFIAAAIISIFEIYVFYKHIIPENLQSDNAFENISVEEQPIEKFSVNFKNAILDLKSNKAFLLFCLGATVFHTGWYMGWPIYPIYEIDHLHSNEAWTSIFVSIFGFSSVITYPYWNRFAEKHGNAFMLSFVPIGFALTSLAYPFIHSIYWVIPCNIIGGVSGAGVGLLILNSLYEVTPPKNRTIYLAYFNTLVNILLSITPFLSIWIKDMFSIQAAFFVTGTLRASSAIIFYVVYRKLKRLQRA